MKREKKPFFSGKDSHNRVGLGSSSTISHQAGGVVVLQDEPHFAGSYILTHEGESGV